MARRYTNPDPDDFPSQAGYGQDGQDRRASRSASQGGGGAHVRSTGASGKSSRSRQTRDAGSSPSHVASNMPVREFGTGNGSVRTDGTVADDQQLGNGRAAMRIIVKVLASIVYWPFAIVGVTAPFMSDFNFGTLSQWQVVFTRIWLAFALVGLVYALIVNLGGIRNARFFRKFKPLKIALVLIVDLLVTIVLVKAICML